MNNFCVIIPAIKKNVAFPDDLVKKLNGTTLVQRAIYKAKELTEGKNIIVITDSEEISLICKREIVRYELESSLKLGNANLIQELKGFLLRVCRPFRNVIILWPYLPLIDKDEIVKAYNMFCKRKTDILFTLKEENHKVYKGTSSSINNLFFSKIKDRQFVESKAFIIFRSCLLNNISEANNIKNLRIFLFKLNSETIEIKNYQDWWICEKLLQRKRIVFRVAGGKEVGMGHIYRCLTLAHEITDHEIYFVCDEKNHVAVNKIAGSDYKVETAKKTGIPEKIISLKPDLVINDILNTDKGYVLKLKSEGIKVVNFEDLGLGASFADLTINELYEDPRIEGNNIKWGNRFLFLRDEFTHARPNKFRGKVNSLLITFGGTDVNNLTLKTLDAIDDFCNSENVHINIVAGQGYLHKNELSNYLAKKNSSNIEFISATDTISEIMEKTQIAISSNGRTIYELYHMKIPSIIISQHKRERDHSFAKRENGFLKLEFHNGKPTGEMILSRLKFLVNGSKSRKELFENMNRYNFLKNKEKVVKTILALLK